MEPPGGIPPDKEKDRDKERQFKLRPQTSQQLSTQKPSTLPLNITNQQQQQQQQACTSISTSPSLGSGSNVVSGHTSVVAINVTCATTPTLASAATAISATTQAATAFSGSSIGHNPLQQHGQQSSYHYQQSQSHHQQLPHQQSGNHPPLQANSSTSGSSSLIGAMSSSGGSSSNSQHQQTLEKLSRPMAFDKIVASFLVVGAYVLVFCEAEETLLLRRVKRTPDAESNNTKLIKNVTLTKQDAASSNASTLIGKDVAANLNAKSKEDSDLKNIGVDLKTAITEMRRLQTPVLRVSRHFTVAETPISDDKSSSKDRQKKKRNSDKDAHADLEKGHLFFSTDIGKEHADLHGLHKLYPRPRSTFEGYGGREKLFELLTGETEISNGASKHLGDLKPHHDTGKSLRFHGKLKRNAKNELTSRHNLLHKDERDYDNQLSNYATVKDSPIIKLTKMLINLEEADDLTHMQNAEESIGSPEMIFKPFGVDSDESSFVGPADYFLNSLSQEYALNPNTFGEYPMALIPNTASIKVLPNDAETAVAADKESPDDEYEMACPVHFKKSVKNGPSDGVVEVCSCHLYRKKKKIA